MFGLKANPQVIHNPSRALSQKSEPLALRAMWLKTRTRVRADGIDRKEFAGRPAGELFSIYPVGAHARPSLEPHGPQGEWFGLLRERARRIMYNLRVRLEAEHARWECKNIKL